MHYSQIMFSQLLLSYLLVHPKLTNVTINGALALLQVQKENREMKGKTVLQESLETKKRLILNEASLAYCQQFVTLY